MFDKRKDEEEVARAEPVVEGSETVRSWVVPKAGEAGGDPTARTSPRGQTQEAALIGSSIVIEGDVSGEEKLIIAGTVKGQISLDGHDLVVLESGRVEAEVKADVICIDGEVSGDVHGRDKVIVSRLGRVSGNIVSPRVVLEDGALFKGHIDMDPGEREVAAAPAAAGKAPAKAPAKTERRTDADEASGAG